MQNSTINGLILSGGNATFDYLDNTVFNGTILADGNINMKNALSFTLNYNANIFSPPIPGFSFSGGETTVAPQDDWDEIVPAS